MLSPVTAFSAVTAFPASPPWIVKSSAELLGDDRPKTGGNGLEDLD